MDRVFKALLDAVVGADFDCGDGADCGDGVGCDHQGVGCESVVNCAGDNVGDNVGDERDVELDIKSDRKRLKMGNDSAREQELSQQ